MSSSAISVSRLCKSYGDHHVLRHLDLEVEPGKVFALLGENGAGKSTTIQILSTVMRADSGTVKVGGHDLSRDPWAIRKMISVTGQYATVDEQLTGEENLIMMGRLNHLSVAATRRRAQELLAQFDLVEAKSRLVKTYSGGMRRRLDIAISLLASPSILFLDEPTTGLDPRSRMNMWALIRQLADEGMTVFLTTQYLDEADQLADVIAVMDQGRIVASGTPAELKALLSTTRLEFVFASAEQASAAAMHMPDDEGMRVAGATLSLAVEQPVLSLHGRLNELMAHGFEPIDVMFRKPTMDDVFMQFTAKGALAE